MKIKSLMLNLFSIAVLVSFAGCSEIKIYEVNPPEDLQDKINQIAEEKRQNQVEGEEELTITTAIAGNEDCSTAWWGAFSDSFRIPAGKLLTLEFVNHGSGVNNWNNYNLCVTGPSDRDTDGYFEYFLLRSDAYGWGNSDFNLAMLSHNYADFDLDADDDFWDDFRELMQGAYVKMKVDHSKTGNVFVHIECTSADGTALLIQEYQQPVSATEDIKAFLVCDGSWFEMKRAVLTASEVEAVDDQLPVSIVVNGYPEAIELGSEDVWGDATAVVTFEDGSNKTVGKDDVSLTVPDLSTVGVKQIICSYSKTKLGEYGPSVATLYNVEVINPVVELRPECNVYIIGNHNTFVVSPQSIKVTAVLADRSTTVLKNSQFSVAFTGDKYVYSSDEAEIADAYTVTYKTQSGELTAVGKINIFASDQPAQTEPVGQEDLTTAWWSAFSYDWNVPEYTSQSISMTLRSQALSNWHSPSVVLRSKGFPAPTEDNPNAIGYTEYVVVRMDHWGWGTGYDSATVTSNWNWETFLPNLDGAKIVITVANAGDGKASVRYHVVDNAGEVHFQYYDGLTIDSADCNFAAVPDCAYLIFD